jgi:3-hydroxyacyl-CoA dehydrogenase/enoyl-CoA hydratase/3-hydroxybutyryl-CoA epimerase/3-hydroxyacyl-CoA dehydrogenase/enoyl-CoA hydratase/3-hydroxybutyryl-CoA epimerase/enoyl-CoA isomerase
MSNLSPALDLTEADGIAILTLDMPGVRANTLGAAMIEELERAIATLAKRTDLAGLIFRSGKPGMFIAGADLKELGSPNTTPEVSRGLVQRGHALVAAVEALPYPTVAAIDGPALGGGLELAMGFDYRIASTGPKTELGLPEVKVGLIPGWGGTQRLPRLIGPALAGELIAAGESMTPDRARQTGLAFDAVPVDRLIDEAKRLLQWARTSGDWKTARARKQAPVPLTAEQAGFTFAVLTAGVAAKVGPHYPAPLAAVDSIARGCMLPLEKGLAIEADRFIPLVGSPVSRNLIAVFFQNQRLAKDTGVATPVEPRTIGQVGVIGAGLMGAGIAGAHVRRGVPAIMLDTTPAALEKGVAAITKSMAGRVEIGRMAREEMLGALARLSTSLALPSLSDRDLVVEAIIENEEAKVGLYRQIEPLLPPGAILASNTSTISITRMAKAVKAPDRFAGLHFFNPVDRMQLVEVIRGEQTSDQTTATLVAHVRRIGKTPIVVRDCPGFLVNRVLFFYLNEALMLLEEGASPRAIDKAATDFGMPMGPITLSDVVGLDTSLYAGRVIQAAFPDRSVTSTVIADLVAAGRLGQKSGAGFYSYAKGSRGIDDPALEPILAKVRKSPRTVTQEEITERLFLPMVTEASRVLMEKIVRDPGDVDMGLILGTGFPPFRGGLLRWADSLGASRVLEMLRKYEALGPRYRPTELLTTLAATKGTFYAS